MGAEATKPRGFLSSVDMGQAKPLWRFFEGTKNRASFVGACHDWNPHKWRISGRNGALPECGTEDVCAYL